MQLENGQWWLQYNAVALGTWSGKKNIPDTLLVSADLGYVAMCIIYNIYIMILLQSITNTHASYTYTCVRLCSRGTATTIQASPSLRGDLLALGWISDQFLPIWYKQVRSITIFQSRFPNDGPYFCGSRWADGSRPQGLGPPKLSKDSLLRLTVTKARLWLM